MKLSEGAMGAPSLAKWLPVMMSTSLVLLSDQMALERSVDTISNNIANSSTTGFKREGIQFNTLLGNLGGGSGASKPINYVYDRSTYRDMTAGTISNTGNPLDLAIQGSGYFQIQTPQGTQLTRDGAFRTDGQGQIVTSTGNPLLSDGGQPIIIPDDGTDVTISGDGSVSAQVGTGSARTLLGKIGVVTFDNDQKVTPTGNNMYTTTQTPIPSTANNDIIQGAIEESNVKPVAEITSLIAI